MGRGYTQYTFPDDEDERDVYVVYSAFLDYVLGSDEKLHVEQAGCYCPSCKAIDMGEHIESVAEYRARLDQLRDPNSREREMAEFFGPSIEKFIDELERRIKWRSTRIAPPKCLHCGCTEIIFLEEGDEIKHPFSGKRMKIVGGGFLSMDEWHATYTPEGDVISSSE